MANIVEAAKLSEIEPGSAKVVNVDGKRIAIFNADGTIYAIDDRCTHEEASLAEGEVEDAVVECPLHGARFDLATGKNLCLPAVFPVKRYDVKIEADVIYLSL